MWIATSDGFCLAQGRCEFTGANLRGALLAGANLQSANLQGKLTFLIIQLLTDFCYQFPGLTLTAGFICEIAKRIKWLCSCKVQDFQSQQEPFSLGFYENKVGDSAQPWGTPHSSNSSSKNIIDLLGYEVETIG